MYAILGDDIAIADERLATAYQDVMRDLGVGITLIKCVTPGQVRPGREWNGCEFASKLFTPRGEASPLATGTFLRENPVDILTLLLDGTLKLEKGDIRRFPWTLVDYLLLRGSAKITSISPDKVDRGALYSRNTDIVLREIRVQILRRISLNFSKSPGLYPGPSFMVS